MPRRIIVMLLAVASLVSSVSAQQSGSGYVRKQSDSDQVEFRRFEVLMEGGLAVPTGNLGAEFLSEEAALGADNGFMLGIRVRFYLSKSFTVAPVLAYTEFGDYDGRTADDEVFTILTRIIRYGLDFAWMKPGRRGQIRPFLGAGGAFVRNKYREDYIDEETFYDAALNGFTMSAQAGARWRDWELALEYQRNTFSTALFLNTGVAVDYDWSHVLLRVGVALPSI